MVNVEKKADAVIPAKKTLKLKGTLSFLGRMKTRLKCVAFFCQLHIKTMYV